MLVWLQGAASGCCCQTGLPLQGAVLLSEGKPLICDTKSPSSVTPKPPWFSLICDTIFPSSATPYLVLGWVGWGGGVVGWGGVGWDDNVHVPVRTQARQPHHTRAGGGSLSLSLPGGPFWPLSSPNPPKRTSPAWSAWLCSLLSLWWSVLAAQQPKSSKADLASLVCLAVLLALPLVVRFGRSAAQILQNGPRHVGVLGCAPCSPSGGPFWPLSSPNPPKRTSPAWSAGLCSLLSLWWSVWPLSSPNPPKRTSPTLPLTAGARRARTLNLR